MAKEKKCEGKCPKANGINILPLADRVVLKILEDSGVSAGGIVLVETAKEAPQRGKVIAVGDGLVLNNGTKIPLTVQIGDTVLFQKYSGTELKFGEDKYLIVKEDEIVGIVKES